MKIDIIGCCGSGKSYFSKQLQELTKYPLYHLDMLYWKENWTVIGSTKLNELLKDVYKLDNYIIDGNYINTLEERFKHSDIIFFLDLPLQVCLDSEKARRGTKRDDLPAFLEEKEDPEFIEYIKNFPIEQRPIILNLLDKYKDTKKIYIFKSRHEKDIYLERIKNKELL